MKATCLTVLQEMAHLSCSAKWSWKDPPLFTGEHKYNQHITLRLSHVLGVEMSPVFLLIGFLSLCAMSSKCSLTKFSKTIQASSNLGAFMQGWDGAGNCWLQAESPGGTIHRQMSWLCRNLCACRSCSPLCSLTHSTSAPVPQIKGTHLQIKHC